MKHQNTSAKKRARAEQAKAGAQPSTPPLATQTAAVPDRVAKFENPDDVEILLRLRAKKRQDEAVKLPPPDRAGALGSDLVLDKIFTAWYEVTPARALDWLNYNSCNRTVSKGKVQSFARQILNGDYVLTHQGIAFNDAEELIDGQHFLKAIVLTQKTARRMVTFGLPKTPPGKNFRTMDVIDSGGRSVADQLKVSHGFKDGSALKQIAGALSTICYGLRTRNLSVGQTLEVYEAFKSSMDFILQQRSRQHGLKQAGLLAAFVFARAALGSAATTAKGGSATGHQGEGKIDELFHALNSGRDLADLKTYEARIAGSQDNRPIEHLRYFLTGEEAVLISKTMNRSIAAVTLQVLYAELHSARTAQLEQSEVGLNWFAAKQKERVKKIADLFKLPNSTTDNHG